MSNTRLDQILKMIETHPNDPFLHYASALEYEKLEQNERAIEILEKLLLTQSDYLPTYFKTGQLHELVGNTERSIELYLQGKKLARLLNDFKTEGELSEALMLLDVFDE
jgi:tetratricopeptide (TPR) repeat protein